MCVSNTYVWAQMFDLLRYPQGSFFDGQRYVILHIVRFFDFDNRVQICTTASRRKNRPMMCKITHRSNVREGFSTYLQCPLTSPFLVVWLQNFGNSGRILRSPLPNKQKWNPSIPSSFTDRVSVKISFDFLGHLLGS